MGPGGASAVVGVPLAALGLGEPRAGRRMGRRRPLRHLGAGPGLLLPVPRRHRRQEAQAQEEVRGAPGGRVPVRERQAGGSRGRAGGAGRGGGGGRPRDLPRVPPRRLQLPLRQVRVPGQPPVRRGWHEGRRAGLRQQEL